MESMLFYLIVNRNGFEEALRVGTEEELESEVAHIGFRPQQREGHF